MARRDQSKRRSARTIGYTMVELMMALTVLAIGVSGIIAMQKITVASNQHAKNLALATHIAETWSDELEMDATRWNFPNASVATSDIDQTWWLTNITGNAGQWLRPSYVTNADFGPDFDALGNPTNNAGQVAFCTHIRLSWIYAAATNNGLIRADIRVFWPREGRGALGPCATVSPADVDAAIQNYHFVHHSTLIREHTAF